MDKMNAQSNQVTACLVSTQPGVYDNTSTIQQEVGGADTLHIRLVYNNRLAKKFNEVVLASEFWLLVLFCKGNDQ